MRKKFLLLFFLMPALAFLTIFLPFPKSRLVPGPAISLRVLDRNGILLREVLSDEGGRCRWVRLEDVSPHALKATIAAEDKLFFFHHGVSPLSVLRALRQNLRHRGVISGASTITQQLVRTLYPGRRNIWSKAREAWLALRLERTLSKPEILVQYINRISYGNQVYGIEAASRLYLDKPSAQLSLAEAAFLAAIPRSPSRLNPYRDPGPLRKRQADILAKMSRLGFVTGAAAERACAEALHLVPAAERFRAPHFCDFVLSQVLPEKRRDLSVIETTLDYALQQKIEALLRNNLAAIAGQGVSNGAVVVLDNGSGEVLSLVGSRDFFDGSHGGQVNGALALRQPGSTLKPFTYSLALEKGLTAASLIDDSPDQYSRVAGSYRPQNYDRRFHGQVSLRAALACSYNVPAVALLQAIGPDLLYHRLHSLGFAGLRQDPGYYGVGLTLGNGEVSLLELVRAYAALARQGIYLQENSIIRLVRREGERTKPPVQEAARRIISPQVAYIITHILADQDARTPSFGYHNPLSLPFAVAAKTGTSKDFRDNWTVGFSSRHSVGVWVGNFDGAPMHNVSGISGSGPLFRDIMVLLSKDGAGSGFAEPEGIVVARVCPLSGHRPTAACPGTVEEVFISGTEPHQTCAYHKESLAGGHADDGSGGLIPSPAGFAVAFPRTGDTFKIDPVLRKEHQRIKLRAAVPESAGIAKVEWWVNGDKVGEAGFPFSIFWNLRPGSFTIRATAVREGRVLESPPVKVVVLT